MVIAPTPLSPIVVQRPCFTPTRGPGGGRAAPKSEPQLTDYTPGRRDPRPRLRLRDPERAGRQARATLRPGQSLLGWRLEAVSADAAIFALNGQRGSLTASGAPRRPVRVGVLH